MRRVSAKSMGLVLVCLLSCKQFWNSGPRFADHSCCICSLDFRGRSPLNCSAVLRNALPAPYGRRLGCCRHFTERFQEESVWIIKKLTNIESSKLPMICGCSGDAPWDLLRRTGFAPNRSCVAKPLSGNLRSRLAVAQPRENHLSAWFGAIKRRVFGAEGET